jgi:hypothetical protein
MIELRQKKEQSLGKYLVTRATAEEGTIIGKVFGYYVSS